MSRPLPLAVLEIIAAGRFVCGKSQEFGFDSYADKNSVAYQEALRALIAINVNKAELKQIADRFPEHISRISEWERLVSAASKRQVSTFFSAYKDPTVEIGDVHQLVEWAQTSRGGRQYDLLGGLSDNTACSSAYGLCE